MWTEEEGGRLALEEVLESDLVADKEVPFFNVNII